MQQSDYEIVGKFGFESRPHREKLRKISEAFFVFIYRHSTANISVVKIIFCQFPRNQITHVTMQTQHQLFRR